jgi:hypothetical protein
MKHSNPTPPEEFLHGIHDIFHPVKDGSFYINHGCFLVNQNLTPNRMYILIDYEAGSITNITTFQLEDVVIFDNFLMITGVDLLTNEEVGRMAYINKTGCAFKLVDFDKMKEILNVMEEEIMLLKAE